MNHRRKSDLVSLLASMICCAVALMLCGGSVSAQDRKARRRDKPGPESQDLPGRGFISSEMRSGGKVVKGAPYSAEAVTESIQTLANGTKLAQKTTALVYRDSEGRTRREQSAATVGPFGAAGKTPRVIFINDPVAGVAYTLYPDSRTGHKVVIPPAKIIITSDPQSASEPLAVRPKVRDNREGQKEKGGREKPVRPGGGQIEHPSFIVDNGGGERRAESLGKQMIDGFHADGERTTVIIPVNQIGNDQPREIVEERWKSPELRTTLVSKTSDPRWGETTYKLININRTEPDRLIFVVPGDYLIREDRPGGGARRPPQNQ